MLKERYKDDLPVIVEEYRAGKIGLERATRELLYIGLSEEEAKAELES